MCAHIHVLSKVVTKKLFFVSDYMREELKHFHATCVRRSLHTRALCINTNVVLMV